MVILPVALRNKLERAIIEARKIAEAGAKAALETLAVHHYEPYGHMSPEERELRKHLRAKARHLGDKQNRKGELEITHLLRECAYEHWHRMLFARYLAENDLLIEPGMGVAISLSECEELAKEEGKDLWLLASEFAQRMLPQIFRLNDPVLKVTYASEHRIKLEKLLEDLEEGIFTARDSLGWVYQFWQTTKKKEVNESGNKIGADELPAVTQLFTEPYMVDFLVHNTIGAWWAGKVLDKNPDIGIKAQTEKELRDEVSLPGLSWDYLRLIHTGNDSSPWTPATGKFQGWPQRSANFKILDPCCGSGHFLVALLYHLVPIRMVEDGLSAEQAIDAILKENVYGLEIDDLCTKIAAFSLALAAWTYPKAKGYRKLPQLKIACSGLTPNTTKESWTALIEKDKPLYDGMVKLHKLFEEARYIGSLINPKSIGERTLFDVDINKLYTHFQEIIETEENDYERIENGIYAFGIAGALEILRDSFDLVITNVPYLARVRQGPNLKSFTERYHDYAKYDLATAFVERNLSFCDNGGSIAMVTPQNWLFLTSYKKMRKKLLSEFEWNVVAKIGENGFESPQAAGAFTALIVITNIHPQSNHRLAGCDASNHRTPKVKAKSLKGAIIDSSEQEALKFFSQKAQLANPDSRIILEQREKHSLLSKYAESYQGICTGDFPRFGRFFWEIEEIGNDWEFEQAPVDKTCLYGGYENVIYWQKEKGDLFEYLKERLGENGLGAWVRGRDAWGKTGIAVRQMRKLPVSMYLGNLFDNNMAVIIPKNEKHLPVLWSFCSSVEFNKEVRKIDQKLNVPNKTLLKIPFDFSYWKGVTEKKYPGGLPKPHSPDPTQWLFDNTISQSSHQLQVSVAAIMGYRWPKQESETYLNDDPVLCIPSVRGDDSASSQLLSFIAHGFKKEWPTTKITELINATGSKAKDLEKWLRYDFFEQHCKLFRHRPFIWHIWDGRVHDGFHALINYHRLVEGNGKGRQLLENLTYSYLGDWIVRQKEGVKRGEGGAEDRLAAALELQKRLITIIEGEPPFDIFVRWKPIERQSIGWEPDINDGIRLNIRPFMAIDIPGGRKGAGILRWKPNIKWGKDRGKEPFRPKEQYPWFWKDGEFTGDRVNDVHFHIDEKSRARGKT